MFKPSVSEGISLSVFEYPQLHSRWVAYFWVKMKYLSISLLLTCQTEISAGGGGGGRAVKEEDLHNLPLLISVDRKQDLPRTLWCSFPSSLHLPCTPRSHRTRGIEW